MDEEELDMALFGTIVDALAIILGSFIGLFWRNINENMKSTILDDSCESDED